MGVDFSTFAGTFRFAKELGRRVPVLHVALLNVGVCMPDFRTGPDGYEISLQVTVLSTVILALQTLPMLRQAPAADDSFTPHLCLTNGRAFLGLVEYDMPTDQTLIERINVPFQFVGRRQYDFVNLASFFAMLGLAERSKAEEGAKRRS